MLRGTMLKLQPELSVIAVKSCGHINCCIVLDIIKEKLKHCLYIAMKSISRTSQHY